MISRKKPNFIWVRKKHSFTRREAAALLRAHLGHMGLLRVRYTLDRFYFPEGKMYQIGIWHGIGDYEVLGQGASWRKAFENAGVFFENGRKYRI